MSIADKEVFAFRMVNYVDATEGDAYLDMSQVDIAATLTVGCIQIIFLNKFVSSILVRLTLFVTFMIDDDTSGFQIYISVFCCY